jgi:hypothetical protein
MASAAMATLAKMMESLPESTQQQVVEHVRDYLADIQDELRWEESFRQSRPKLALAAQQARKEIAEGKSQALNYDDL